MTAEGGILLANTWHRRTTKGSGGDRTQTTDAFRREKPHSVSMYHVATVARTPHCAGVRPEKAPARSRGSLDLRSVRIRTRDPDVICDVAGRSALERAGWSWSETRPRIRFEMGKICGANPPPTSFPTHSISSRITPPEHPYTPLTPIAVRQIGRAHV